MHVQGAGVDQAVSHTAKGVVKKIDAKSGMVSVAHGPAMTMNWPAMTMTIHPPDSRLSVAGGLARLRPPCGGAAQD